MLFKSSLVQELMKRGCSGTILTAISDDELRQVRLPDIPDNTQQEIAGCVRESFTLRRKSEHMTALAVKCVELAVEQGEHEAVKYLRESECE